MPDHRHGAGWNGDLREVVAAPYVAIALERQANRTQNAGRRWQFGLVIPKALVGLGQLKIETGFGPIKTLRLSTLMLGEEFVPVKAGSRFGIKWISDEVDHTYKSAVQQNVDAIEPNVGYVFTGSGKIRTQTSILTWGENYIFVWKNPAYSIPDTVDHYFVDQNDGWRAAVVTLPTEQDEAVVLWLRDQFGAAVTTVVRQWGILYPPPLDRDADGNITVGSLSELFVGFVDAGDDDRHEAVIAVRIEKQAITLEPSGAQKRVASIAIPPELDNYPLTLSWGARALQPVVSEKRKSAEWGVEFTFRTANGLTKTALHRPVTAAILNQVRAGDVDIVSVDMPKGVSGTLCTREGLLDWKEVQQFKTLPGVVGLSDEQISILTEWLRKRAVEVQVSFGCFGEFTVNAETARITQNALSRGLRERLKWHLRLSSQGPIRHEIDSLSDAAIVQAIRTPKANPAAAARQNMLLNELKIELGEVP